MSLDSAQYLSGTSTLEDGFLIDVIVNGGGESVSGVFNPEDIERFGGDKVPKAFTVDFELMDTSCVYKIEDTQKSLSKIYQSTAVERNLASNPPYNSVSIDTTKNWCKNGGTSGLPKPSPGIAPTGGNCDLMQELGEWGYWSPEQSNEQISGSRQDNTFLLGDWRVTNVGGIPFYSYERIGTRAFLDYKVKVKVINSEGKIEETILTSKDKNALLGNIGQVKVVGNLLADEFCEIPGINYAIVEENGNRKIVEKSLVDNYFSNYLNLVNFDNDYFEFQFRQQRIDPGVGADWIFGTISGMNNALRQIHEQNLTLSCYIKDDNSVVCPPETQVAYPELQLFLASNYLGISKDKKAELENRLDNLGTGIEDLNTALEQQRQQIIGQLDAQQKALYDQLLTTDATLRQQLASQNSNIINQLDAQTKALFDEVIQNRQDLSTDLQSKYAELNQKIQTTSVSSASERQNIEQNINELNSLIAQLQLISSQSDAQTKAVLEQQTTQLQSQLNLLKSDLQEVETIAVTPIINKPKYGIPKIKSATFSDTYSNEIGDVSVQIDNIGNQTDSFDVDIKCTPNDLTFGAKRVSINPNSGTTVDLKYTGEAGKYDCTVSVIAVNNPANQDRYGLKVEIAEKPTPTTPQEVTKEVDTVKQNIVPESNDYTFLIVAIVIVLVLIYFASRSTKRGKRRK